MTVTKTKKKFAFDVGWVFASLVIVLVLHFLQKPVLARYLGPDGLGLFSMVIMIGGIIEIVSGLGIPEAVVKYVAEYKNDKSRLYPLISSAFLTMIIFGATAGIVLFMLSNTLASIFKMPLLSSLLEIYAFVFPFLLIYMVIIGFLNGLRKMRYYSFLNILQAFFALLLILIFFRIGFGVKGAVFGFMLAIIVAVSIALFIVKKFVHFTILDYKKNTKKLMSFGSKIMLGNVVNLMNLQIDILLVGYFLTATDVGYYAVAVSLSRFFWLVPRAIRTITYPSTSEYWIKNKYHSLNEMIDKSMKYSSCLLLIAGLGVWVFAKDIIVFLFGELFISSIIPLRILVIGTVIFGIFMSIGGTLAGIGRPDLSFKINAIGSTVNVALNILLIQYFGIAGAAIATITSFIVIAGLSIYFIVRITKIDIDIKWFASIFTLTLLMMGVFFIGSEWINPYILGSLIFGIYIITVFMLFLTKEDKETFRELIHSIVFRG